MSDMPKRFVAAPIAGLAWLWVAFLLRFCLSRSFPNVADAGRIRFGAGFRLSLGK